MKHMPGVQRQNGKFANKIAVCAHNLYVVKNHFLLRRIGPYSTEPTGGRRQCANVTPRGDDRDLMGR